MLDNAEGCLERSILNLMVISEEGKGGGRAHVMRFLLFFRVVKLSDYIYKKQRQHRRHQNFLGKKYKNIALNIS